MHRAFPPTRRCVLVFCLLAAPWSAAFAQSETPLDEAFQATDENLKKSAASQRKVERLDDETKRMLTEYQSLQTQNDALKVYTAQMKTLVADQEKAMEDLRATITRAGDSRRSVMPLAREMVAALRQFVLNDMPFQREKRLKTVDELQLMLSDADVPAVTKFQRILEAYELERNYGRTVRVWRGKINQDSDRLVEFLQVGRNVFINSDLDRGHAMFWDRDENAWRPLDKDYQRSLQRAFRVARRSAVPELLVFPVKAPQPQEQ